MSGVSLTVTVRDAAARAAFARLARAMDDTTPVMAAIGTALVALSQQHIDSATSPDGTAFAPLSPGYAPIKRGPGILRDTNTLRGSLTRRASRDEVEVGTNVVYAAVHQFGATIRAKNAPYLRFRTADGYARVKSVTIPARPYLGIGPAEEQAILDTLEDALDLA